MLKNGAWAGSFSPGNYNTSWEVAGLGDYNGDGNADVMWLNSATGEVNEWIAPERNALGRRFRDHLTLA